MDTYGLAHDHGNRYEHANRGAIEYLWGRMLIGLLTDPKRRGRHPLSH